MDRLLKSPTSQRGRDFGVILSCLNNLGYYVEWRVINAAEYGFQQRRRRTFIFACHKDTKFYSIKDKSIKSILQNEGFFSSIFKVKGFDELHISHSTIEYKLPMDILETSNNFKFDFKNSGICFEGNIYTVETSPCELLHNPPLTLLDILEKEVDEKYYLIGDDLDKWTYMKGAKAIERTSKTGHKYTFREGALSFPDPIDRPARTMLTSEGSKNRSTHVVEDLTTGKLRLLTPVECERINGFPDNWTNTGMTHSFRYFTMGNALVVNLITLMAEKLSDIIEKED